MREHLIYCQQCEEYSLLGRFIKKQGVFEGEYSLLHNARMQTDELLCRFLMEHRHHPLQVVADRNKQYTSIIGQASRYKEKDIDNYVEQSLYQKQKEEDELSTEQAVGQIQLTILKKMLEEETEDVSGIKADSSAKSQFLLGKEEGLKQALKLLQQLVEEIVSVYQTRN